MRYSTVFFLDRYKILPNTLKYRESANMYEIYSLNLIVLKIFEWEYTSGHSLSSMLIQGQLHMFVPYPGWPQSFVRVWQAQVFLQSKIKCLQKLSRLGDDDDDDYNDDNEKGGRSTLCRVCDNTSLIELNWPKLTELNWTWTELNWIVYFIYLFIYLLLGYETAQNVWCIQCYIYYFYSLLQTVVQYRSWGPS